MLITAAAVTGAVVWANGRGGGSSKPAGEVVAAERGDVAVTVGGVGHVNTLAGAAVLAVPAAASPGGGGASSKAGGSPSSSGGGSGGGGAGSTAPADAVFPSASGHVTRLLVKTGDRVVAGEPIAVLADDGTVASNVLQARSDLETGRLELAQKRVQDPLRGVPPTGAERVSGSQAVTAARAKLNRVLAPPAPADVAAARLDYRKAIADLAATRSGGPEAIAAARLAVETARQKLVTLTGAPDPAEVTAVRLELAKAMLDQETLLHPPDAPSAFAVRAADLAVVAAQQKVTEAEASGTLAEAAAARAELGKAQSDRDALNRPAPTPAAQAAAQLAVDAASQKLDALVHPPAATVTAARRELATAEADLAGLATTRGRPAVAAARAGVTAARRKLSQLRHPAGDVVAVARSDVRKAEADLAVLLQRGAPAGAIDLALARLKVGVAAQRLALAEDQTHRLTVQAPASGTVTSVLTAPGAAADPTTPLARVENLDNLVVTLDLSEFDVGRIRVGAPARVGVDALGGRKFGGSVSDIASGGVDNGGVVNFPVVIALDSHQLLRPGMSVSARVIVSRRRNVVRIPLAAVVHEGDRPSVMVRTLSGDVQRRVEIGLSGAEFVEVRSGVRPGERVVVPTGGGGP